MILNALTPNTQQTLNKWMWKGEPCPDGFEVHGNREDTRTVKCVPLSMLLQGRRNFTETMEGRSVPGPPFLSPMEPGLCLGDYRQKCTKHLDLPCLALDNCLRNVVARRSPI